MPNGLTLKNVLDDGYLKEMNLVLNKKNEKLPYFLKQKFEEDHEEKNTFLRWLYLSEGSVQGACIKSGYKLYQYHYWSEDPLFLETATKIKDMFREVLTDLAIFTLKDRLERGDEKTAKFIAETLGRKRGFGRNEDEEETELKIVIVDDDDE